MRWLSTFRLSGLNCWSFGLARPFDLWIPDFDDFRFGGSIRAFTFSTDDTSFRWPMPKSRRCHLLPAPQTANSNSNIGSVVHCNHVCRFSTKQKEQVEQQQSSSDHVINMHMSEYWRTWTSQQYSVPQHLSNIGFSIINASTSVIISILNNNQTLLLCSNDRNCVPMSHSGCLNNVRPHEANEHLSTIFDPTISILHGRKARFNPCEKVYRDITMRAFGNITWFACYIVNAPFKHKTEDAHMKACSVAAKCIFCTQTHYPEHARRRTHL